MLISDWSSDVCSSDLLTQAFQDWFGSHTEAMGEAVHQRILLVDDSPFFRNMLTPLLTVAGYAVTAVESVDEALGLREAGEAFAVTVSDNETIGRTSCRERVCKEVSIPGGAGSIKK